jgi:hypothetical protein
MREPDGRLVGRAALTTRFYDHDAGTVTDGGLRVMGLQQIAGVLLGRSVTPARDMAQPLASPDALSKWATEQARILATMHLPNNRRRVAAWSVYRLGGDTGDLPVCEAAEGPLTRDQLVEWVGKRDQITVVPEELLQHDLAIDHPFELAPDTIACPTNEPLFLQGPEASAWPLADPPSEHELNKADPIYGAVMAAWGHGAQISRASAGIRRNTTPKLAALVNGEPARTLRYLVYTRRLKPSFSSKPAAKASRGDHEPRSSSAT